MLKSRGINIVYIVLSAVFTLSAQITNLTVNGVSANFSLVQGALFQWEYNLPVGGTAMCEIWLDINGNGQIDPAIDKSLFGTFTQTDGDLQGNNGPFDMDSLQNGHCLFKVTNFGLPPGKLILRFSNNSTSQSIAGIVSPLSPAAYTMSGKVTPPPGISPLNLLVSAESKDADMNQWMGLCDGSGNFIINFNQEGLGRTYRVRVNDDLSPYLPSPSDTTIVLNGSISNINFRYSPPSAKISGYLKGEDGHIFQNVEVNSWANNGGSDKRVRTNANGLFEFGYSYNELVNNSSWSLEASSEVGTSYLAPSRYNITVLPNDSLRRDLTAYLTNDSISGYVRLDGRAPGNRIFYVQFGSNDSGKARTTSAAGTGYFSAKVAKKVFNYYPWVEDLPQDLGFEWYAESPHPGATNVILNISTLAWLPQNSPTNWDLHAVAAVNSSTAFAAGNNGTILGTTNGGINWNQFNSGAPVNITGLSFISSTIGWGVGSSGGIGKTTDGGMTWSPQSSNTQSDLNVVKFINTETGWAAGGSFSQAVLLKTTNGGTNWQQINIGLSGPITSLSVIDQNLLFLLCNGMVYKSTNGGAAWFPINSQGGFTAIYFISENKGWAVGNGNRAYSTGDGGLNWAEQYLMSGMLRDVYALNANTIWLAGDNGAIFRSTDGGGVWVKQPTNNQNSQVIYSVRFADANNGWCVGANGSILHTSTGGVTAIGTADIEHITPEFALLQNYPNPFNPTTTISFSLQQASRARLIIYDLLGRETAKLADDDFPAGINSLQWNAGAVPSGVYFCRLQINGNSQTRKLLLIK